MMDNPTSEAEGSLRLDSTIGHGDFSNAGSSATENRAIREPARSPNEATVNEFMRPSQIDPRRSSQIDPPRSSQIDPPRASQIGPPRSSQIDHPSSSQIGAPRSSQLGSSRSSQIDPSRSSVIDPSKADQIPSPRPNQMNHDASQVDRKASQIDQRPVGVVEPFIKQGSMRSDLTPTNQHPSQFDQHSRRFQSSRAESSVVPRELPHSRNNNDNVSGRRASRDLSLAANGSEGLASRGRSLSNGKISAPAVDTPEAGVRLSFGGGNVLSPQTSRGVKEDTEMLIARLPSRQLAWAVERMGAKRRAEGQEIRRRPGNNELKQRGDLIDPDLAPGVIGGGADLIDGDEVSEAGAGEIVTLRWAKIAKYRLSLAWTRLKQESVESLFAWSPWSGQLKIVEGKYGSGVTSYFLFLRDLVFLNLLVFLLTLAFVVIPQTVYRWGQQVPAGYASTNPPFTGWELLIAQGWFENTEMLYGYYTDSIVNVTGATYDMKFAYISTAGAYYLLTLLILATILSGSVQSSYLSAKRDDTALEAGRVFYAWSFTVTHRDTARLNHSAIHTWMKELLSGSKKVKVIRSTRDWAFLIGRRVLINVVILGSMVGSGFLVWEVLDRQAGRWRYNATAAAIDNSTDVHVWASVAMPLTMSAVNFVLPAIFAFLVTLEQYENAQVDVFLNMGRTVLLALGTLAVLTSYWFSDCANRGGNTPAGEDCVRPPCWENLMGSELYTMVVIDFIFIIVSTFLLEFVRRVVAGLIPRGWLREGHYLNQYLCVPEFDIGRNTLSLVYSQLLVWLGMFYCPLLALIMVLKLIVVFYIKRVSVVQNCAPPAKAWRVGYTTTFLLLLLFLSFLLSVAALAYGQATARCSQTCGPFQRYNYTYEIFAELGETSGGVGAWIISMITSIGFGTFVVLLLGVVAFYSFVIASGHREMARSLHKQILQRNEEKQFLLQLLQEANLAATMKRQQSRGLVGQTSMLLADQLTNQAPTDKLNEKDGGSSRNNTPANDSNRKGSTLTPNPRLSSVKSSSQSQSTSTPTRPESVKGSVQSRSTSTVARPISTKSSVQSRHASVVVMETSNPVFDNSPD